jgi:acyl carrier protein
MEDHLMIRERVKEFIVKTSYISEDKVDFDTLIFAEGIMDSMGFVSIIEFIQENYSIIIRDDELIDSNFESVNAISVFIVRKLILS